MSKKAIATSLLSLMFLAYASTVSAATYTKEEFLTVMLNYKYSEDYKVSKASSKCGDTKNTVSESNWYLDIDDLNIKGKTNETYLYFNGMTYLLTGKIKKTSGKYKINLTGDYASTQSTGTADVSVKGVLKDSDPLSISKLKIKVTEHRNPEFTPRTCLQKATVKSLDADTFLQD